MKEGGNDGILPIVFPRRAAGFCPAGAGVGRGFLFLYEVERAGVWGAGGADAGGGIRGGLHHRAAADAGQKEGRRSRGHSHRLLRRGVFRPFVCAEQRAVERRKKLPDGAGAAAAVSGVLLRAVRPVAADLPGADRQTALPHLRAGGRGRRGGRYRAAGVDRPSAAAAVPILSGPGTRPGHTRLIHAKGGSHCDRRAILRFRRRGRRFL